MSATNSSSRRWKNVGLNLERDPRRTTTLIAWILGALLALTPLVTYVVQQNRYVETRKDIRTAEDSIQRMKQEEHRYTIRRGKLQSLDRAEDAATVIGLENPGDNHVVWVEQRTASQGDRVARNEDR
jgi:hypothetical protein